MKTVEHLEKDKALLLLLIPAGGILFSSVTLLITLGLFGLETLIFGILAFICSIATGLRFWDVYYRLSWKKKNVYPLGFYRELVGQAKESPWEKGMDWAIPIIGGALIGFSFLPKYWFITAFILYLAACLRHTTALKRKDWRKGVPKVKIGQIKCFLKEKQRGTIVYMALFFIGFIAAWKPYIINSLLTWITENPKYIVVIWVGLILVFRYVFRFIQERHEIERIKIIKRETIETFFGELWESITKAIRKKK